MKYLVKNDRIVGKVQQENLEAPEGYTYYENTTDEDILGYQLIDGVPTEVNDPEPTESVVRRRQRTAFWGTPLFKKAYIKGNLDPMLAFQVGIAIAAENRGDVQVLDGAIKSIQDVLRRDEAKASGARTN